jgi:protein-serine/threonine kinase
LECASGGELFDHILAHKYLKEKDACKLFAQLISGVWYMHNKKIVHRDLKLENLLLDRNRNVIITDFGFANRFEHRTDDLMQTSCGSPCYAAPELVISEGLYVGSAVDIWSCGVILYAMLAGYLPFDDDPENPDGDNINLLYKYIVNTELTFPDYISKAARDLLSLMLVPDPKCRADLRTIMLHSWLEPYRYLFERSVKDLEAMAAEQQRQKRLQYQKQMTRHAKDVHGSVSEKMMRSQSAAVRGTGTEGYDESFQPSSSLYDARPSASTGGNAVPPSTGRKATALSDALGSADDSFLTSPPRPQSVQAPLPSSPPKSDHPATPGSGSRGKDSSKRTPSRHEAAGSQEEGAALGSGTDTVRSKKGMRHTIQVEYSADPVPEMGDLSMSHLPTRTQANNDPFLSVNTGMSGPLHQMIEISESMPSTPLDANMNVERRPPAGNQPQSEKETTPRKPANNMPVISISPSTPAKPTANSSQKITATSPTNGDLGAHVNGANDSSPSHVPSSWPRSAESLTGQAQTVTIPERQVVNGSHPAEASSPTASATASIGSGSSKRTRHIRNISLDKLSFRRPGSASGKENLTAGQRSRRQIASESAPTSSYTNSMVSTATGTPSVSDADNGVSGEEKDTVKANDAKARRRKTLSIMMEPIKNR